MVSKGYPRECSTEVFFRGAFTSSGYTLTAIFILMMELVNFFAKLIFNKKSGGWRALKYMTPAQFNESFNKELVLT